MSPYPAGSAKIAGNAPRASNSTKVNPTILHACADVKILGFKDNVKRRKLSDAASHKKNTTIGVSAAIPDRKSTRLNSSHSQISYAVFCLKKKNRNLIDAR